MRISVRAKLLLLSALLLAVPYVGYQYVREMERYLRQGLEDSLDGAARAVAGALHGRRSLFHGAGAGPELYAHALTHPIQLDGYADDWAPLLSRARALSPAGASSPDSVAGRYLAVRNGTHLYLLFLIDDDRVVYRDPAAAAPEQADHLRLVLAPDQGPPRHYVISTSAPGWVAAIRVEPAGAGARVEETEPRIRGEWQERAGGYTLELRIPLSLAGSRIGFDLGDVDDPVSRPLVSRLGTGVAAALISPSPEIQEILHALGQTPGRRISVLDAEARVLAQGGQLSRASPPPAGVLYSLLLGWPPEDIQDSRENAPRLHGEEVQAALAGQSRVRWYTTGQEDTYTVSASSPVRDGQQVLGAVVVEETTQSIQTVRRQALADLFDKTLLVFFAGALLLLLFATRLSARIRRLRDQSERAVDSQGRVREALRPCAAGDEIGDLSRAFAAMVERLAQYNRYLENMSARLSHELRTPLAVVRSSLDNLDYAEGEAEARVFVERAREGLTRLDTIITRMSEATRLEQALQNSHKERFDLGALVQGCVEAYRAAWPRAHLALESPAHALPVDGAPELVAQMLDKLVANAIEFGHAGTPITIGLRRSDGITALEVSNQGPPLPEGMHEAVFESMVSVRPVKGDKEPHLGLGLYVVRLISDFHGARVRAGNRADGSGVVFRVELPVAH